MKKYWVSTTLASTLVGMNASGYAENIHETSFHGLYIGAGIGYMRGDGKIRRDVMPDFPALKSLREKFRAGNGGEISVHGGYHHIFNNNFLGGAEFSFSLSNLTLSHHDGDFLVGAGRMTDSLKIKIRDSLSLALKVGKVCTDMLPYFKLGVINSNFKMTSHNSLTNEKDSILNSRKRRTGILIGAGVQKAINEKTSIGVELVHTRYQALKFTNVDSEGDKRVAYKISPHTNSVRVYFTWKA